MSTGKAGQSGDENTLESRLACHLRSIPQTPIFALRYNCFIFFSRFLVLFDQKQSASCIRFRCQSPSLHENDTHSKHNDVRH